MFNSDQLQAHLIIIADSYKYAIPGESFHTIEGVWHQMGFFLTGTITVIRMNYSLINRTSHYRAIQNPTMAM